MFIKIHWQMLALFFINRINSQSFLYENEFDSNFTLPLFTFHSNNNQHVEKRSIDANSTTSSNGSSNINRIIGGGDVGGSLSIPTVTGIGDDEYTYLNIGVLMASHLGECFSIAIVFASHNVLFN